MGGRCDKEKVVSGIISGESKKISNIEQVKSIIKDSGLPDVSGFSSDVVKAIIERIGQYTMEIEDVAKSLEISVEQLKYRLKENGSEFIKLRTGVRKNYAVARFMMGDKVDFVACRSGFSEARVFSMRFKTWTGFTANEFKNYYRQYRNEYLAVARDSRP